MTTRKFAINLLKVLITGGSLGFALSRFDLGEMGASLAELRWTYVAAILLLMSAGLAVRGVRWWALLRGLDAGLPLGQLILLYFSGNFFNTFLPSGFGGDVVRVMEAGRRIPPAQAAGSVLVDRLMGLLVLFAIALVALPFRPPGLPGAQVATVAALAGGGLVAGLLLLDGRLAAHALRWLPEKWGVDGPLGRFLAAVSGAGRPALVAAAGTSLAFNAMLIAWWWLAGQALGYSVALGHFLLAVPLLSISLLAPSVGGLGVREVVAQALFAAAGLGPAQAATLSLLEFTLLRLTGLLGAPTYLLTLWRDRRDR